MKMLEDKETQQQISRCLNLLQDIFGHELLGVYLFGSSIVGGLQKYSDIDLLAVSNRPSTPEEKTKLVTSMLTISGVYQKSLKLPIDMTIVVKSEVNPWHYPLHFDFKYGDWLRKEFEMGNIEPWPTKVMPDLALLVTQVLLASKTIFGPAPNELLDNVPYRDFIKATVKELDSLMADLSWDTRNVLLTLARIWSTVETDTIRSKSEAASWVIDKLPAQFKPVIQRARAICLGEKREYWDDIKSLIQPCADFMVSNINEKASLLKSTDYANKSIKLAE